VHSEQFDFSGKVVFVAGGSSGINLAIADAFAAQGAALAIASRSAARVATAQRQLERHGGAVAGYIADVRDYAAIEAALRNCHDALGAIDVLVSGAAGNFVAPALGMSSNGFRTVVDIDLIGGFNVTRAAHAFLRRPGACVLNISAPQASNPTRFQAHVCAAKAGLDMLMRVLALEWGQDGIRVNSLIPGPIGDTEGINRLAPGAGALAKMAATVPLGRMGTKQDVAAMALMLASPLASFVTGAAIAVDGGVSQLGGRDLSGALAATKDKTRPSQSGG